MKHFQDDDYDPIKEYESHILYREEENDPLKEYEHSIMHHDDDFTGFDDEATIKHFQDY